MLTQSDREAAQQLLTQPQVYAQTRACPCEPFAAETLALVVLMDLAALVPVIGFLLWGVGV
jgi:hypothetical protein